VKRLLLCAALVLFTGCASKNYDYLSTDKSILESKKLSVATYPQDEFFCGPSSLATILNHQHVDFVYGDVIGSTFTPELKGTLQVEMKATARRYGLIPYAINPNLASILSEVSTNRPVLVLFNLGLPAVPVWHYSVVTGFNKETKQVYLSGTKENPTWMSFDEFETFFVRGGSWAIVALKPPLLPVASSENEIIKAIVDMAEVGYKDPAKQTGTNYVKQHPLSFLGSMMLANIHFETKDYSNASSEYKRALVLKPNDPVALNNLAQSLLKENKLHEAKLSALAAVNAGGTFVAESQMTLEEINRKLQQ
jgi:tetratricopeptide (TPR) repeat protein